MSSSPSRAEAREGPFHLASSCGVARWVDGALVCQTLFDLVQSLGKPFRRYLVPIDADKRLAALTLRCQLPKRQFLNGLPHFLRSSTHSQTSLRLGWLRFGGG